MVFFSQPFFPEAEILFAAVEKHKISALFVSSMLCRDLVRPKYLKQFDLSSIKMMLLNGSEFPNSGQLLATFEGVRLFEMYGLSEMPITVFNYGPYATGNVGSPLPNVEMKIVDLECGEPLKPLVSGEICFRGPSLFVGYVGSSEKVLQNDGWFHTGDIGFYQPDGSLYVTDRKKELFKFQEYCVKPAEVERFLMSHEQVQMACVVGVKHETDSYHARAFVKLVDGAQVTEQELVQFVKNNLGYHHWLFGGVRIVSTMPLISFGKIDRQHFKNLVKDEFLTEKADDYIV